MQRRSRLTRVKNGYMPNKWLKAMNSPTFTKLLKSPMSTEYNRGFLRWHSKRHILHFTRHASFVTHELSIGRSAPCSLTSSIPEANP